MHDHDDEISNPSDNPHFADIVNARATRRSFLAGSAGLAALSFFGGTAAAHAAPNNPNKGPNNNNGQGKGADKGLISFTSIPLDSGPMPTIAPEYSMSVILPWLEKIDGSGESFKREGLTSAQQEQSIGLGHDGMWLFDDEVLCLNQEYGTNYHIFGRNNLESLEEVRISQAVHGVAVVALQRTGDTFKMKRDKRNRRVHVNTPVEFSGPVKGSQLLEVAVDNDNPKGTVNNCSMGYTPWGTYVTCEENFHQYFGATAAGWEPTEEQKRVGLTAGQGWDWHKFDERFDLSKNAGEEHRFGWVVEIDPQKPNQKPIKRTSLGRFKHEGATVVEGRGKRVVVYSGDDERNEYIYKFVSAGNWKSMFARGIHPLDEGVLYVAKFNEDGSGEWLELSPKNPKLANWSMDRILVHTRMAADVAGATKMDRPEWITVGQREEMFCTLTNNTRPYAENRPGNPPGPNSDGHIVKWVDTEQHTGTKFQWDFFAIAKEVKDQWGQMFGSPDGIWADQKGRVFVETDGAQPGGANDQLLVADQATAEFKRLLTGVKGGEVTGITVADNQRVMLANIQHPGNGDPSVSNFPEPFTGASGPVPRDATIVIVRKNGGIVGS
ncbi:PhoX family protein [Granulicoccus sp. GXG6511]|uniref:PhoX family protein n=1 Tax=Granulicoccus sp. GXG6511 TaxID=3381351 RepID=UPI003D7CE73F